MASRTQSPQLAIQHVRNPGERMPVANVTVTEGPADFSSREPRTDVRVFGYVGFIVEIDEFMPENAGIDGKGDECQTEANKERAGSRLSLRRNWTTQGLRGGFASAGDASGASVISGGAKRQRLPPRRAAGRKCLVREPLR